MARSIRSAELETRTARLKLPVRKKPYTARIAQGIRLAYRRNQTGGVWSVLKSDGAGGSWLQRFAAADDHEDANGSTVLSYFEACDVARKLARGDDAGGVETEAGRPVTVAAAIEAYARDLRARDGNPFNARILRTHLPPAMMQKPVAMLTAREVRAWRDSLLDKVKRASVNRYMKCLKACLNLAAADDDRITNQKAWKLPSLKATANPRNVVLDDQQVRDVVAASYKTGGDRFGMLVEVLATTGTRPSQAKALRVADLEAGHADGPRLLMPSSRKGNGKKRVERTPVPIPAGLAMRLKAEAAGRAGDEPLLRNARANAWVDGEHQEPFLTAAAAAALPRIVTAYTLRHTSITRALLANVPTRLVAAAHDTSVVQLETTYSKYIARHGDDLMRSAMIDLDAAPAAANVVPLTRAG